MSDVFTVFYSWQSDLSRRHCRDLIRKALDTAADRITGDASVPYSVAVFSDTQGEPGLCNIPETILRRIREADAMVLDLSFVAQTNPKNGRTKYCSNPNVLFELGYAFQVLGPERLICVLNEAHGPASNQIFDLAHHRRPITYESPKSATQYNITVNALADELEGALRVVITHGLSGAHGGEDAIMHERQRSEIEAYYLNTKEKVEGDAAHVTCYFRPKLYRENRMPDGLRLEEVVRSLSAQNDLHYPPNPTGNAVMNWGLYNDTYGAPWTLTYAGQFWTSFSIAGYEELRISERDASVSPLRLREGFTLSEDGWIDSYRLLRGLKGFFSVAAQLASNLGSVESVEWTVSAQGLKGKWLRFPEHHFADCAGPSLAPQIRKQRSRPAQEFASDWKNDATTCAKAIFDTCCRDGREIASESILATIEGLRR